MHYKRVGAALVLLMALTRPIEAQVLTTGTLGAANQTVAINPTNAVTVLFAVQGTFSGTITFQCDANGGGTYTSILATNIADGTTSATTTSTGNFSVPGAGCVSLQAKMTSYASGTANVSLSRGYFVSRLMYPVFTTVTASHFVGGDFTGTTYTASSSFVAGNSATIGWADVRFSRSATKAFTIDDGAGGAITGTLLGSLTAGQLTANQSSQVATDGAFLLSNKLFIRTTPTISSGFGSSPSVVIGNGAAVFLINVGTGGSASSGVIGMPAAANGWVVNCTDLTTPGVNVTKMTAQSASAVTVTNYNSTTGIAAAWTASDVLHCLAMAY